MLNFIKNIRAKHFLKIEREQFSCGYKHAMKILIRYSSEAEVKIVLAEAYRTKKLSNYMLGYEQALIDYTENNSKNVK